MNILIPVLGFNRSGGQRVLAKLADQLILNGNQVTFVVPSSQSLPYYSTNANIIKFEDRSTKYKKLDILVNLYRLHKKCSVLDTDIAIANYNLTAYVVAFLPFDVKKIYYIQAYEVLQAKKFILKLLAFITYKLPLKKIVNSKSILPDTLNNYVGIVPAGIDTELFKCPRTLSKVRAEYRIGLIGRKEPYKGTIESIVALSEFMKKFSYDLQVNIAIHKPDVIDKYFEKYNFYEINCENDLAEFYKQCDVILAVGLIEDGAFHYPCAEAMSSSCLVISNYAPLSLNEKSKLFIPSYSKNGIISKLVTFSNMTECEILDEIDVNRKIIEKLSWDTVGKEFYKIISTQ